MLTCPLCSSTLSEAVYTTGMCPVCGGALHLDDKERGAAADGSINHPVKLEYVEDASITDSVAAVRATLAAIVRQAQQFPVSGRAPQEVNFTPPRLEGVDAGSEDIGRTSDYNLPINPDEPEENTRRTTPIDEKTLTGVAANTRDPSRQTEIGQTIDVRNLSPQEKARVTAMWKGMATPVTSQRKTLKGAEEAKADNRKTTLVVKARDVRQTSEPDSVSADYELLNLIGEGGMGVVYAARQASIDRVVALKMLNPEIAGDSEQRSKFLSEAVVTGELDHPNIVPIYDLGSNESGALFYSMKRVVGTPWLDVIQKYPLPQNLEVLMKVADAVAFAHSRGVIHRDLKPENVMLGGFGEVLVMDWGLALSTGTFRKSGSITQSSSMGGTPAYMAPEMATGPVDKVTAASDIYLLGGMLYEVITGQPPHTGKNIMNCLYAAARNEIQPTKHSGELVDVALRAMSTNPANRYATVQEFQAAVRAYQSHSESIVLSTRAENDLVEAERTKDYQTFARSLFGFQEAVALWTGNTKAALRLIEAKLAYARAAVDKQDYDLAASLLDQNEPKHADLRKKINAAQKERQARQARLRMLRNVAAALVFTVFTVVSVAFFVVYNYWNEANVARNEAVEAQKGLKTANAGLETKTQEAQNNARIANENAAAAKKSADEARENLKAANEARAAEVLERTQREYQAYVAQIGLAAAKIEENAAEQSLELLENCIPATAESADYRNWEWWRLLHLARQPHESIAVGDRVESVMLSADDQRTLIGTSGGNVKIVDAAGQTLRSFSHGGPLRAAVYVGGTSRVITVGGTAQQGTIKLWDVEAENPQVIFEFEPLNTTVLAAAATADGAKLVTTSADGAVRIWQLSAAPAKPAATEIRTLHGHSGAVWDVDFSPDDTRFVTSGQDRTVILWSLDAAENDWPLPAFRGHTGAVLACAFSPDGRRVVSAGADRRVLVWDIDQIKPIDLEQLAQEQTPPVPPRFTELKGHTADVSAVDFAPDGRQVLSASNDHTVKIWDAAKGVLLKTLRGHEGWVRAGQFTADSHRAVTGSDDNTVAVWPVADYQEQIVYAEQDAPAVLSTASSPDGRWIITAHQDGSVRAWDRATGKRELVLEEGHDFLGETARFFPSGDRILTGARDSTVRIWQVGTGGEQLRLNNTGSAAQDVVTALAPAGDWLCTGIAPSDATRRGFGERRFAQLWHLTGAAEPRVLTVEAATDVALSAATFAKTEPRLFTGRADGLGEIWTLDAEKPQYELRGHTRRVNAAQFSADDSTLFTASDDHTVQEWDARTGERRNGRELFHKRPVTALAVTPDDQFAITASADNKVRVWNLAQRAVAAELPHDGNSVSSITISPDGSRVATVSHHATGATESEYEIHLWDLHTLEELKPDRQSHRWVDALPRRSSVWSASFSPDGDRLLAVGGRHARIFNLATQQQERSFGPQGAVQSVSFAHQNSTRFVAAGADGTAKIWDLAERHVVQKLEGVHTGRLYAAIFTPDDSQVLTAGDDGQLVLWDAATGAVAQRFAAVGGKLHSAEMSADGTRVVTAGADGNATIWNAKTGEPEKTFRSDGTPFNCAALAPDGKTLMTGDVENRAQVFDAVTGELKLTLTGHTSEVTAVAYSPDSTRILTAARDNLVKVWDLNGKELLTLRGHGSEVTSASFVAEGQELDVLTSSRDGAAILWPAAMKSGAK